MRSVMNNLIKHELEYAAIPFVWFTMGCVTMLMVMLLAVAAYGPDADKNCAQEQHQEQ